MSFLFDGNQGGTGWTCLVSLAALTQSRETERGKTASTLYANFLQTL